MTTLLLIGVALFVVALPALIAYCLCVAAGRADRLVEQSRPPGGSVQARVDQDRRDALNTVGEVADTVWPEPGIRHTPGGWRA